MAEVISSIKNDKIKYVRKLYNSRKRKKEGKYILEGSRLIKSAINMGAEVNSIFLTQEFVNSSDTGIFSVCECETNCISQSLMNELADTVNPQGIIAVVDEPEYNRENFLKNNDYTLVLDRIQDPGNMGTLIRTAAAAGFDGVIALKGCVDIYNLKVIRATAGAIFSIPVINKMSFSEFKKFKNKNKEDIQIISADINGEEYYHRINYKCPLMVVIGNEANGISGEMQKLSNTNVKIPVSKEIDSLNAAVAGSLIMYRITIKKLV